MSVSFRQGEEVYSEEFNSRVPHTASYATVLAWAPDLQSIKYTVPQ
jgi:hypothetical protein